MTEATLTQPAAELEGDEKPPRHDRTAEEASPGDVRSPRGSRIVRTTLILITGVAVGVALSLAVINVDRSPAGTAGSGADAAEVRTSNSNSLPLSPDAMDHWSTHGSAASSDGRPTSADAAERWAAAQLEARRELCTSAPISVDSAERCMADR